MVLILEMNPPGLKNREYTMKMVSGVANPRACLSLNTEFSLKRPGEPTVGLNIN